jgi:hypothetical protein
MFDVSLASKGPRTWFTAVSGNGFLLMNILVSLLEVRLVCVAVQSLIHLSLGCALGLA